MESLFAGILTGTSTFGLIMTAVAAALAGYVAYQVDEKIEDKRRHALDIGQWATENGLEWIARLMNAYGIGDKSGMARELADLYKIFRDDKLRQTAFAKVLDRQLAIALADPDRRGLVYKAVDDRKALDAIDGKK